MISLSERLFHPYSIVLLLATVGSLALAIYVLRFKATLGTRSFVSLMTGVALWSLVHVCEIISTSPETALFFYRLQFVAIVTVPVSWLLFGLYYANRIQTISAWRLSLLMIVPVATVVMAFTDNRHHLFLDKIDWIQQGPFLLIDQSFGPWFWVHTAYSYILLSVGTFFLVVSLIYAPYPYRGQAATILIGSLVPWFCNSLYIFNISPLGCFDLTPIGFPVAGAAFLWGILRFKLLDIVPIARDIVLENMRDAVMVTDSYFRLVHLNAAAGDLFAEVEHSLIGSRISDLVPGWQEFEPYLDKAVVDRQIEWTISGAVQVFDARLSRVEAGGKHLGFCLILRDVTSARAAESRLKANQQKFRSLSENAPVVIFTLDADGLFTYVNPAWENLLGYQRHGVLGKGLLEFVAEDYRTSCTGLLDDVCRQRQAISGVSIQMVRVDGARRLFTLSLAPIESGEDRCEAMVGIAEDVTEERRLELQLFQAQKMEAIGTLAGGIAHDFNNLLMGIQANISLLSLDLEKMPKSLEKLARIEEQILSGASLTRQLLGYARKGKYRLAPVDLKDLIATALNVIRRTHKDITIKCDLPDLPMVIDADRSQMEMVLLNLFVNAADAMPHGGQLAVNLQWMNLEPADCTMRMLKPGRYILMEVSDTGTGMTPEVQERIFEPFFTTKELGRGTGLGLASVYGVIKNHGGQIEVESQPGKGTTFSVFLPASSKKARDKSDSHKNVVGGNGRILLVDDEPVVLDSTKEMIAALGYSVMAAGSGEEALEIYSKKFDEIDLVILDMVMPGMDGKQVFDRLKQINSEARVLISSGYDLDDACREIIRQGSNRFIKKPYTLHQLATEIAAMLAPGS